MNNIVNQIPYLRTSRSFPEDIPQLTVEVNKAYIDIANAVNNRTISIFATNRPVINGESWFINSQRQQGFRQIYTFTSEGNFPHGLNFSQISMFTNIYGTFTDNTNWYPLPFVDITTVANQVALLLTGTNIVIVGGGGVNQPQVRLALVVLEWIAKP